MSSDFLVGIDQTLLNNISAEIYPGIKEKLSQTSDIPNLKLKATWSVDAPPKFDLSKDSSGAFDLNLSIKILATPDSGGQPTSETVPVSGSCVANIKGDVVVFSLQDFTFQADPFLTAIVDAKKGEIISMVNNLLQGLQIKLGPVTGVSFSNYAWQIKGGAFYTAGSINGAASIDNTLPPLNNNLLGISLSEALVKTVVQNTWWASAPKTIHASSDVTVNLNGYSLSVTDKINISLSLGGDVYVDEGLATAHWSLNISTVNISLNISIDQSNNVVMAGGSISTPTVILVPANWLAGIESVGAGLIGNIVVDAVVSNQVPGGIRQYLNGKVFPIPDVSENFQGVNLKITPKNLEISVNNGRVQVIGTASASVG